MNLRPHRYNTFGPGIPLSFLAYHFEGFIQGDAGALFVGGAAGLSGVRRTFQALTTTSYKEDEMATSTIPKILNHQTLEIPLEELKEVREIWYGVCAFNQMLNKLDGDEEDLFALRHFHKPLRERFTDLLAGEPAWDQRMVEVEMESEKLTPLEAGNAEFTLAVKVEDLQKIIDAANQIEALLELLPDDSPVVPLLKPIDGLLGKALYGPAEVATAVLEASKRDEENGGDK